MLDAALDLAACGWILLPCDWRPGDRAKAPMTAHGVLDATDDPDVIRSWWSRWPDALIGARVDNRLLVLDLDPRSGGRIDQLGELPATLTCWSGRGDGGRHLYFFRPAGPLTSTRLPPGCDLKTNTGYCIVAPSRHPDTGQPYRWEEHPVAPVPPHLRELLRPAPRRGVRLARRRGDGRHLVEFVARQPWGNVNNGLHWAACRAADDNLLDNLADDLVAAAAAAGHPEAAARRTVESAARKVAS